MFDYKDTTAKTPWEPYMGETPMHLNYFQGSMCQKLEEIAKEYPNYIAFTFMGKNTTYKRMMTEIHDESEGAANEFGLGYDLVAGANIAGFKKVATAMLEQGVF